MTVLGAPSETRARLERIETIRLEPQPNIVWVEVTDENGVTGLGETYYVPGAVEAVLHDSLGRGGRAPAAEAGCDPRQHLPRRDRRREGSRRGPAHGAIGGAGLDVYDETPLPPDHPLVSLENVVLTPHSAAYTEEGLAEVRKRPLADALRVLRGESPKDAVP